MASGSQGLEGNEVMSPLGLGVTQPRGHIALWSWCLGIMRPLGHVPLGLGVKGALGHRARAG